ncbi:MAG TPA: class I SAM-dependent methyltransferase [Candidatus Elarobacter sp.]|jgi:SAM-dependent methyltransferase|nr:class I SAM-dependent methyltransferase [Candidatus Elarobacter sp.]
MHTSKGRSGSTVAGDYFRDLYRRTDDPWHFSTSPYERAKYRATLDALPRARYRSALELACSIGVFTAQLAQRAGAVLGVDVSPDALASARRRCASLPNVRFAPCDLAAEFPPGSYDLVTFCEAGFYFGPRDLARIRDGIANALEPGGDLVLVHWTPLVEGHAQTADDVHEAFLADARFAHRAGSRAETYRLDVCSRW